MKSILSVLLLIGILTSCEKSQKSLEQGSFTFGINKGILDNEAINEASGLATSMANPGFLWTHNDSGDKARVFLIDTLGHHRATVFLEGIRNRDWEDITIGPGPEEGKNYIYIGEIGDNDAKYAYKYIYRIEEPKIAEGETEITINQIDSIQFNFSNGVRDSEGLMIEYATRDLYIFSKREKQISLYRLPYPQNTDKPDTAEFICQLPYTQIVAADLSIDGNEVLIKNYDTIYYWKKSANEALEELLKTRAERLPYINEPQGESICFDRNGYGYYTTSEERNGVKPQLFYYRRTEKSRQ